MKDLDIQPYQGHQQPKGTKPLHVFGSTLLGSVLDEVEVEDEVQGGDDNDEEAEPDADQPALVLSRC